jgi:hypothetical protein
MLHRSTCADKFERSPANDNRDNGPSKIMQSKDRHAASYGEDIGKRFRKIAGDADPINAGTLAAVP